MSQCVNASQRSVGHTAFKMGNSVLLACKGDLVAILQGCLLT